MTMNAKLIFLFILGSFNLMGKLIMAWAAWMLGQLMEAPEWGTICLIIIAVQSTYIKVVKQ